MWPRERLVKVLEAQDGKGLAHFPSLEAAQARRAELIRNGSGDNLSYRIRDNLGQEFL